MALLLVGSGACGDDDATACTGDPGSAGCACRGDMSCDEGLACTMDNLCAPEMRVGLAIPAGAQGCDVLLTSAGDVRVTFGDAVEGTWVSERPNHAISAVATAGELGSGAIEVAAAQDFTIASGACVDSTGAAVGEVTR